MISFGLIGCGNIAKIHAEAIKNIQDVRLSAVCDIDESKGQIFANRYNALYYSDYTEMLKNTDIDAIIIATPHYLHKEMTISGLNAKKHVLCEKPMATNIEDGKEISRVLKQTDKVYAVCYQNRFNASSLAMKHHLETNSFGKLKGIKADLTWNRGSSYYSIDSWKGTWGKEGGGVLINQAIHTLDLITWLIERPIKIKGKIMTTLLDEVIEVEDAAMATAIIQENIPVVIHASNNYTSDPTPTITFDFQKNIVSLTQNELIIDGKIIEIESENERLNRGKVYWGNGHYKLIESFINMINNKSDEVKEYLPSMDALDSLMMVCGIYESSKSDEWFDITMY